jgi:AraC-like DNA-binding protein
MVADNYKAVRDKMLLLSLNLGMPATEQLPVLCIKDASVPSTAYADFNIGRHEEMGKAVLPSPHKHDFYLLLVIRKGAGEHRIDFETYTVEDRMVFFLAAGQAHQWNLLEKTIGYQVMFMPDFLPDSPARLPYYTASSKPFLQLNNENFELLAKELESLKKEFDNKEILAQDVIRLRLQVIMKMLQRWYVQSNPPSANPTNNRLVVRFFGLLEKHYQEEAFVHFYARQLHVTPNYLNIVCRKETGVSAGECIRQRILLEAKRLLAMTGKDVREISFDLGFEDPAYFSRFFKQNTGTAPRDFRKQL